jgi:hypothetical protein
MADHKKNRNRIVIETSSARSQRGSRPLGRQSRTGHREGIVALSVIGAAALATFIALFLTSRPYDPMNSTLTPGQAVPAGSPVLGPSPKPTATISPSPQVKVAEGGTPTPELPVETATVPDDAGIQFQIDRTMTADPALSKLDVSTLVEGGKVTVVGSVRSADLKQRVEKTLRSIKGVVSVDNQLVITETTP